MMSTSVSPFRVWTPSDKPDLDFVPELSNVQESAARAAWDSRQTFLQSGLNGETRLASGTLWRVPLALVAVRSEKLKAYLAEQAPTASVLNLFGATHYLGCGHLGLDNILRFMTGYTGRTDRHHTWSGELKVEPLTMSANMTSRLGFEINARKKQNTTRFPREAVSLLKRIAVEKKIEAHNYNPAAEHFAPMPTGHDPRHPHTSTVRSTIALTLSVAKKFSSKTISLYDKNYWRENIDYFDVVQKIIDQEPELYASQVKQAVDRLIVNLSAVHHLASNEDTRPPVNEELTNLYTQIVSDLKIWCDYEDIVVTEIPAETVDGIHTPAIPPSPHKMFDVVLVPETRFENFWRRWVG